MRRVGTRRRVPAHTPLQGSNAEAFQRGAALSVQSELSAFQLCIVLLHFLLKRLIEMTYKLKHLPTCLAPRENQSELILILMEDRSLGKIKRPVTKAFRRDAGQQGAGLRSRGPKASRLMQRVHIPTSGGSERPLAKVTAGGIQSLDGGGLAAPLKVPPNPQMLCFFFQHLQYLPDAQHPRRWSSHCQERTQNTATTHS